MTKLGIWRTHGHRDVYLQILMLVFRMLLSHSEGYNFFLSDTEAPVIIVCWDIFSPSALQIEAVYRFAVLVMSSDIVFKYDGF